MTDFNETLTRIAINGHEFPSIIILLMTIRDTFTVIRVPVRVNRR